MQVHKIVLIVIDFDGLGADETKTTLENQRFPNDCIAPSVLSIESREIGQWEDENPLNYADKQAAEVERLFGAP